jgi:hypothetical protein
MDEPRPDATEHTDETIPISEPEPVEPVRPAFPSGPVRPASSAYAGVEPALARPTRLPTLTTLFMVIGGGLIVGTILQQQKLDYCPNDASRWNTVYYLVEHGTYEYLPEHGAWWNTKKSKNFPADFAGTLPFWTIDMVAKKDDAGHYHFYSSKPPLLPTCLAGIVLVIENVSKAVDAVFGSVVSQVAGRDVSLEADYRTHPWFIMRTTLILTQAIPFMIFVVLVGRQILDWTNSPFARYFCIAAAALGTYLTPWSITLNNHVIAAFTVFIAVHATLRIWYDNRREWYWFVLAGLFGAFAATMELPALSLAVAVLVAIAAKDPVRGGTLGLIPALLVFGAALLTNWLAMGTIKPAYAEFGVPGGLYDYPGSYWNNPTGMDALQEPKRIYLLHLLIGHHGLFLLTPILLLALVGAGRHLRRGLGTAFVVTLFLAALAVLIIMDAAQGGRLAGAVPPLKLPDGGSLSLPSGYSLLAPLVLLLLINLGMYLSLPEHPRPMAALVVVAISVVVIGFYTFTTNNYGGGTQGARWLFWLIPLWLLLLPAGVEYLAPARIGRVGCYALLLISMISVAFVFRQPWADSWAHLLFRQFKWIRY